MKNKIYAFALTVAILGACSKTTENGSLDAIEFNIVFPATKATTTAFENGDAFSLYAVEWKEDVQVPLQVSGNYINNEKIVYDGTDWAPVVHSLYWSDNPCDFYAIYPYQDNISSISAYPFDLITEQNNGGYEASDLLFASASKVSRENGAVSLQFKHMMSKLVVHIIKGEKFEGEIPDDVVTHIYNTTTSCKVNCELGTLEKDAFGAKKTITMKKVSNELFEAIIVPQHIEKRTPLVEITMGGIAYLLETSLSFRPGFVHTINITLNTSPDQEQIEISISPGVDDWD